MNCPFCQGKGRRVYSDMSAEQLARWPNGFFCEPCRGTGDFDAARLIRAYNLGRDHERSCNIALLAGEEHPTDLTIATIRAAVTDDLRNQRHREMLRPGSTELRRAHLLIDRMERERGPLLSSLSQLAAELQEQLRLEVPELSPGLSL